ncbi:MULTISPECIES: hypothetical protein [unclassified Micromonospora]|uniref:hypothetical protein n=1 Tax=unclassified Micromonospora TaxID=2617518 RepID=UPI002DDC384A|nr:hypothetical protein [Micromonospora sp. NBC_01813]WSA09072.1 hypothetical protein OG958_33845 [Micromonospora sp. NBC_01813]
MGTEDTTEPVTDEQFARLRRARFGELPARVTESHETVDVDPAHEETEQPAVRREWG